MGHETVEVDTERRMVRLENLQERRWGNIGSINFKLEQNWEFVGELMRAQNDLQRKVNEMQRDLERKMNREESNKTEAVKLSNLSYNKQNLRGRSEEEEEEEA
jgi:hypothetical protein